MRGPPNPLPPASSPGSCCRWESASTPSAHSGCCSELAASLAAVVPPTTASPAAPPSSPASLPLPGLLPGPPFSRSQPCSAAASACSSRQRGGSTADKGCVHTACRSVQLCGLATAAALSHEVDALSVAPLVSVHADPLQNMLPEPENPVQAISAYLTAGRQPPPGCPAGA